MVQPKPPPYAPAPTESEKSNVKHYLAVRDRIHEGPFYTVLNDGMKSGKKRRANEPPPNEAALFNPFTDNLTYTSKYMKVRRRIPKLDMRPYVTELFPPELRPLLGDTSTGDVNGEGPNKKRKTLQISKSGKTASSLDSYLALQGHRLKDLEERGGDDADEENDEEGEEEDEDKPDAVDEEDNWSAVSSDSEESGDDYNAERYFDGGDDDDGMDDGPDENAYD
jgi:DNA-directed RNA polymerase III subunit RPC7